MLIIIANSLLRRDSVGIIRNNIVVEYNDSGYLMYSESFPGAYTRGRKREEALSKFPSEIKRYCTWADIDYSETNFIESTIVQTKNSDLQISEADSDVIFLSEQTFLTEKEYEFIKIRVLKSASDFQMLYDSIPDKNYTFLQERTVFYGPIPRTSKEIYEHTNSVTNYYVGEIGVKISNLDKIYENRKHALEAIERTENLLQNKTFDGSYGERWSLKKVLRRFIWHDHIHGKSLYRMASKVWGEDKIENPFYF